MWRIFLCVHGQAGYKAGRGTVGRDNFSSGTKHQSGNVHGPASTPNRASATQQDPSPNTPEQPPGAVACYMPRGVSGPDRSWAFLPVGAFKPAPSCAAGREGVLPSSAMAHVSAPTPAGRAAHRAGNAGLRPASRGSAKPARMTRRSANLSSAPSSNPGCRDRSPLPPTRGRAFFMPGGVYGRTRP